MDNKKSGFTLIETIVVIFLSIVILNISIPLTINFYGQYKNLLKDSIAASYLDDALISIDRLLKGNMIINIDTQEDRANGRGEICITYAEENFNANKTIKKIIKFEEDKEKLVLETKKLLDNKIIESGKNIILLDVKDFQIIKKDKIYYFKIVHNSGEEKIQCI